MIYVKRGLDVPISGIPEQKIYDVASVRSVALLGPDYVGIKPKLCVAVGDAVKIGDPLWYDRNNDMLPYTSHAGGVVSAIHRGYKRALLSVVVDVQQEDEPYSQYQKFKPENLNTLKATLIRKQLQKSGMWTALRTRPFSCVPACDAPAESVFINAMDSNPLAADSSVVVNHEYRDDFINGTKVLSQLCTNTVYLCRRAGTDIPVANAENIRLAEFSGPHPSGLSGTHIHYLEPVSRNRSVWTIAYPDVVAIGRLFTTGMLMTERIVSFAGPAVKHPRLLRTRLGADLNTLSASELTEGENRIISGSVLSGRTAHGALSYLGRYHQQVAVLAEDRKREFMGWFSLGTRRHSSMMIYLHRLFSPRTKLPLGTSTHGSERAMVPTGNYERVLPLDLMITPLLRYLIVGDLAMAEQLGCLELDEEDLSLCSYVCSGKYEYGHILRHTLDLIREEG